MLDLNLLRSDPERVRISARRRGQSDAFVDRVLELDAERRAALTNAESLKAEKNALTAAISKAADRGAEAARLKPEIAALDARIAEAAEKLPEFDERMNALLSDVPKCWTRPSPTARTRSRTRWSALGVTRGRLPSNRSRIGRSARRWGFSIPNAR